MQRQLPFLTVTLPVRHIAARIRISEEVLAYLSATRGAYITASRQWMQDEIAAFNHESFMRAYRAVAARWDNTARCAIITNIGT